MIYGFVQKAGIVETWNKSGIILIIGVYAGIAQLFACF
jgi:predicted metal-dependent phosphotriesterase family hydrolase